MPTRFLIPAARLARANIGLHAGKFIDREEPEFGELAKRRCDESAYVQAFNRWERYWKARPASCALIRGRVATRLITGLGNESVTETGIRLNFTYGTPLIAGSSVKGVLRQRLVDNELRTFLFGDEKGEGYCSFADAWWIPDTRPPCALDVMTPHHPGYYTGAVPPTDMDNPTPIPFLSVRGGFLFVIEFLAEDSEGRWRAYVAELLRKTLEKDGIGGKRSAGYGRFRF